MNNNRVTFQIKLMSETFAAFLTNEMLIYSAFVTQMSIEEVLIRVFTAATIRTKKQS